MSGRPVVVVSPNGIEYKALKDLNMNIDDLLEGIRQCNYYSLDQVLYVIIETNGKMSVIPTSVNAPATAQDVKANNPEAQLPHVIVSDGKVIKEQMKELDIDNQKFQQILKKINIEKLKDLIILSVDQSGKIYFQVKGEKYQVIENAVNMEAK